MNIGKIEENVRKIVDHYCEATFIYDLLTAYGKPKASITRLKVGTYNLSKNKDEILWKKNLFFKKVNTASLYSEIDRIRKDNTILKHQPRFVIVTDAKNLLAVDTKINETLDVSISNLPKSFDFFLPWAGMEKSKNKNENPADIKAAEKMAKLYDIIKKDNFNQSINSPHSLNVFFTRILFCFFAEDTGIFKEGSFTNAILSHTTEDGGGLNLYLDKLFEFFNKKDRSNYPKYLQIFPYVNGGLFAKKQIAPKFSAKSRKILVECGSLDWSAINPDIFGSMIQAVVLPDQRGNLGIHYTSITNIMKVVEPLFLNEFKEKFKNYKDNPKKLESLLRRLEKIKIFDPACGSGNFLIIAYKEIRKLEMEILKRLLAISSQNEMPLPTSGIQLVQFYGIELDDFAHEVAILSLWLAEHQMNRIFKNEFGQANPSLPLRKGGNIVCGNATQLNWKDVCEINSNDEIYILGNPPYLGFQNQSDKQKEEIINVFQGFNNFKRIDYIGCWFKKAADYIHETSGAFSFVSTNSICQGEQVCIIWPYVFSKGLEIYFAYQSFSWVNNAKDNAKVSCVIVGVRKKDAAREKLLFTSNMVKTAKNINPYLVDGINIIVTPRNSPLSQLSKMSIGNVPLDGNNFILSVDEKDELLKIAPRANKFIRRYMGAADFMRGTQRYCIWVTDDTREQAVKIPFIADRIEKCRKFRMRGGVVARDHVHVSYRFRTQPHKETHSIIFPKTTSGRRKYVPVGFLDQNTIISEKALAAYGAESYMFGVLSSRMHILWLSITSSRMRADYQYSVQLSYNTFPIPDLSEKQKENITTNVLNVLAEREKHSEKTISELYDPLKMPDGLREAHKSLDDVIERCYRSKPFETDEDRIEFLFKLYEEMIRSEQKQGG